MALITWTQEQFGTTIVQHDDEHKHLFNLLNDLHDKVGSDERSAVSASLKHLIAFVAEHFASEEKNMAAAGYPALEQHKREHDNLVQICLDLQKQFETGATEITPQNTGFLRDWLIDHIPKIDFQYGPTLAASGIK